MRTRVKICGITRAQDLAAAAAAGADAIGLVFYPHSPRYLSRERARALRREAPPFLSTVALFVNAPEADVRRVVDEVRPDALQFHGEETADYCASFGLPYVKTCRAYVEDYGGTGERFEWSLVPRKLGRPLILSGGLTSANVREAIRAVQPWAVDVSSGVESAKGIKDAARIAAFITEVRNADV